MQTMQASFAAGCFWGIEARFTKVPGVIKTEVGYAGGQLENPSYEQVCTGKTGHAETVRLEYDPKIVSYEQLLDVFWACHDPSSLNRQGGDIGEQYRSIIFYYNEEQRLVAEHAKAALEASGKFPKKIVTEIIMAMPFYRAEEYHQRYLEKKRKN